MDISTTSLLANQLQTLDPKATAKESATKIIQESADIPLSLTAQKSTTTPNNAEEVIGQLLGSAVSEAKSKSAIFEILQNNQLFKNMGNFAEDVKNLSSLVKVDSTIAKPLALLQLFAKNIEQIDVKMLQEQIQNSGIFFESKLANTVTQKGVLETIQTLSSALQEHLSGTNQAVAPLAREIHSIMDRLNVSQDLTSKEAQTSLKNLLDLFRQSVKQELASEGSAVFKEVYQTVQKLDYAIKQMDLVGSKVENYPPSMKVEEHFTTQVKVLLEMLKENLSALQLDDLQPQIDQLLVKDSLLNGTNAAKMGSQDVLVGSTHTSSVAEAKEVLKTVQPPLGEHLAENVEEALVVDEAELTPKEVLMPSSSLIMEPMTLSAPKPPETIEEALKMIANRIKQQIDILDPQSSKQADFVDKSTVFRTQNSWAY